MLHLGAFGKTANLPVTTSADSFSNPGPYTSFVVQSDRAVHLSRNGDASTGDIRVPELTPVTVDMLKGDELSYILADGETDGVIHITEVST